MNQTTNWFVITGAPASGKTKIIEYLSFLGYHTYPETARLFMDLELSKGRSLDDIRGDNLTLQNQVLAMKMDLEDRIDPKEKIFLDRGIPDTIAYLRLGNLGYSHVLKASKKRKYKKVFFLEQLEFENDYIRNEDKKTVDALHRFIYQGYKETGYHIISVPKLSIEKRVEFILDHIS